MLIIVYAQIQVDVFYRFAIECKCHNDTCKIMQLVGNNIYVRTILKTIFVNVSYRRIILIYFLKTL